MALSPSQQPPGGKVAGTRATRSGTGGNGDTTNEPGQYPPGAWGTALFGGPLPDGTGAAGSAGARPGAGTDPTNEPGQTDDGLTGLSEADVTQTGAPGMATSPNSGGGGTNVTFTDPGSYLSGTYENTSAGIAVDGPQDSTGANDEGYATGGPQLPGIEGNEPQAGRGRYQPGSGSVMRGGRAVRP